MNKDKRKDGTIRLNDKPVQCPLCRGWFERLWNPVRQALYLICHFDKIGIAAGDPFVGRWDEAYAQGEKIMCPACDHEMRYFATSTGYMQAKCPKKKCQTKIENAAPDRQAGDAVLLDRDGEIVAPAGVDRPIATPDAPGTLQ